MNRTKTVAKVRDEGPEEIAARLGNVRPYRKQDGAYSFYIRLYDRRFRKIETRTVYPPEGCDRGRELESFLLMEIKKFEDEMEGGLEPRLSRMTFSDYFDGPFHDSTMAGHKAVHDYEVIFKNHLRETLGRVKMERIDRYVMVRFLKSLRESVPRPTYNHALAVLHAVFNNAVEDGTMVANPIRGKIGRKLKVTPNTRAMSPEELREVVAAVMKEGPFWRACFLFLVFTGCRRGEAVALRWGDIHLDAETPYAHIAHSAEYVPGEPVALVDPKTEKSDRLCFLPGPLVDALRELSPGDDCDFVFCGKKGPECMIHPDSINKAIYRMCDKNGIERFSPHVFRRTLASILSNREGAGPKTIQSILGHSDTSVLMDHYVKEDVECKRQAIEGYVYYCLPEGSGGGSPQGEGP